MSDLTAGLEALAAEFEEMDRMVSGGEHRAETVRAAIEVIERAARYKAALASAVQMLDALGMGANIGEIREAMNG